MGETMKRRHFIAASAAALALPSVARSEKVSVLKFAPISDPPSLDPLATYAYGARNQAFMLFDTLYGQTGADQGYAAKPQMVAGHTVENDGKTWTLTLRDGLVFHDGSKVLARDCVASIRRWGVRDFSGEMLMQRTDELTAPDDRTIVFRLNRPFRVLPDALGKFGTNMCGMMPERVASTDPFKPITEVIGSGPFRFKADERVPGSLSVFERFDGYKPRDDGQPDLVSGPKIVHFDRVEWHVIPDDATVIGALQTGEVDWVEYPVPDVMPKLSSNSRIILQRIGSSGWWGLLRPNWLFPPFDNPAIRRAPSAWHVPTGYFPPGTPMASDAGISELTSPRDLEKVRSDLQAAGYRGEKIVLVTRPTARR
jgi:peptide/nickel transport system substrate-binding protein